MFYNFLDIGVATSYDQTSAQLLRGNMTDFATGTEVNFYVGDLVDTGGRLMLLKFLL